MGGCNNCCSNDPNNQLENNFTEDPDAIEIRKEIYKLKQELTTSRSLDTSFDSTTANQDNDLNIKKMEIERNRAFCSDLLKEINLIRTNPKSYLKKVEIFEQMLKMTQERQLYIEVDDKKIPINGYLCFEELTKALEGKEKLKPLEFKDSLTINLPSDPNVLQSFDYMANQFVMKKLGLSDQYTAFGFHSDFNFRSSELSCFLQMLDDNNINRPRRKNILNPKYTSVGISIGRIDEENFAIYCIFGG